MSENVFGQGGFSVADLIAAQAPAVESQPAPTDPTPSETETGQPAEVDLETSIPATQEAKTESKKLFANKYETEGALVNGAINLAKVLNDRLNVDRMTIAELEDYCIEGRKRLSKPKEDPTGGLSEKLDKLIELQLQARQTPETQPVKTTPDITDEQLDEAFYESPAKGFALFQKRLEAQLLPLIESSYPKPQTDQTAVWQKNVQEAEYIINSLGDGDFSDYRADIVGLLQENPNRYLPKGRDGIILAYQDAKSNSGYVSQLQTVQQENKAATQKTEQLKTVSTITTGAANRVPMATPTESEKLLTSLYESKPRKGVFG